ncbi:MAG TPA: DEAD/DEAH box helicase [Candidatus Woesebacteria bacterium]|nr:DEAD/DEAH box helicase [Candidatus Woesebacteria bacterium]
MYQLQDSVLSIKGIGKNLQASLSANQIEQVLDLLLFLPLRYEDRSAIKTLAEIKNLSSAQTQISQSVENKKVKTNFVTTRAKVLRWNEYRKGRLLISRATIIDSTEQLNCLWFNNKFLKNKIIIGQEYFFSGNLKNGSLMQATVEKVGAENIHTGRLVPIYPQLADFKQGSLRRLLAETISKLHQSGELEQVFRDLHFPSSINKIILARERLALEEIIYLMQKSAQNRQAHQLKQACYSLKAIIKKGIVTLPFTLTKSQEKAVQEILADLQKSSPMNRLLTGDVGSGKTIVAAIPASLLVKQKQNVCLIVPTKILAQQHLNNLKAIFKDINFQLVVADQKSKQNEAKLTSQATFFIGTHSLLNQLKKIQPSLVIYDEQQRFGVKHRQLEEYLGKMQKPPHLLSMTATPIPRSLMLSIFSHLDLSHLDQMPNERQMATTWLIPKEKEDKALEWLVKELLDEGSDTNHTKDVTGNLNGAADSPKRKKQALIICPFINPSSYQATENVAAVKESLVNIKNALKKIYQKLNIGAKAQLKIAALYSKLEKDQQAAIIDQVYQQKIQILVSTPMVEVGVDLPNADIIVIQSAERFGLSSLHQLRGRVGRKGQKSYCLLFTSANVNNNLNNDHNINYDHADSSLAVQKRLQKFCQEKDGLKLAQMDLENRGAGDIFGYQQSGLHDLRFASWTNVAIINAAREKLKLEPNYQSLLQNYLEKKTASSVIETATN